MVTYSITRLLERLSILDDRILKQIRSTVFVDYSSESHDAKITPGGYQSIRDLYALRNLIKSRIVASNAVTKVTIGKRTYTVADAIEQKRSIGLLKELLQQLHQQRSSVASAVETHKEKLQQKLDRLLEVEFGKSVKTQTSNLDEISRGYWNQHKVQMVDPIKIDEKIDELETFITEFESDVNVALAESNARTMIELESEL